MRIKPLLKLIRLPNVFTAACNSLAGALSTGGCVDQWQGLLMLAGASISLYAAGILLNDLFDLEEDRRERPERPLPSGEVPVWLAASLACVLCVAGVLLAEEVSPDSGRVAIALLAAMVGYDAFLKKTQVGPWAMGLCRGFNLALGLSVVPVQPFGLLAIIGYTVYIAGVTYISRQETKTGETRGLAAGFRYIVCGLGFVIAAILLRSGHFLGRGLVTPQSILIGAGIGILLMLLRRLTLAWKTAFNDPRPETIQNVVKTGIINLPIMDFSLILATAGVMSTLPIVLFFALARLTARKLYTT